MAESARLTVYLPHAALARTDEMAEEHGLTRSAVIRRALGIMQAVDEARAFGRYVGTTRDREALETVIVTPI